MSDFSSVLFGVSGRPRCLGALTFVAPRLPRLCLSYLGAQNGWMPAPDTIDPPSSDTMLALVAEQILNRKDERTCFPRI